MTLALGTPPSARTAALRLEARPRPAHAAPQGSLSARSRWWSTSTAGARGNPGPAAIAAVVADPEGELVEERSESIGPATNNVAEYRALLLGIERARALGATRGRVGRRLGASSARFAASTGSRTPRSELHNRVRSAERLDAGRSAMCAARRTSMPTSSSTRRSTQALPSAPDRRSVLRRAIGGPAGYP